jgi:hypothetical protein
MLATKKKERTLADLADDIRRVRAEIDELVERRVAEFKASRSGRDLPVGWLRHEITKFECPCEAALRLIENG